MSTLENTGKVLWKHGLTNLLVNKEDLKLEKLKLPECSLDPLSLSDLLSVELLSDTTTKLNKEEASLSKKSRLLVLVPLLPVP